MKSMKSCSKYSKRFLTKSRTFNIKHLLQKLQRDWVVLNSYTLIEKISTVSIKKKGKEISTFGFSNLYRNLPHQDLTRFLLKLVTFSFHDGCKD